MLETQTIRIAIRRGVHFTWHLRNGKFIIILVLLIAWEHQPKHQGVHLAQCQQTQRLVEDSCKPVVGAVEGVLGRRAHQKVEIDVRYHGDRLHDVQVVDSEHDSGETAPGPLFHRLQRLPSCNKLKNVSYQSRRTGAWLTPEMNQVGRNHEEDENVLDEVDHRLAWKLEKDCMHVYIALKLGNKTQGEIYLSSERIWK